MYIDFTIVLEYPMFKIGALYRANIEYRFMNGFDMSSQQDILDCKFHFGKIDILIIMHQINRINIEKRKIVSVRIFAPYHIVMAERSRAGTK